MMTTLSNGTDTVTPTLVTGYDVSRPVRTISHEIIGRAENDHSFRPAGLRAGTLRLMFVSETDSLTATVLHGEPAVWTLTDPDRTSIGMLYVVADGAITRALDEATRDAWIVTVPFEEVLP